MFQEGRGVAKTDSEALRSFRKAAGQGHTNSMGNVGGSFEGRSQHGPQLAGSGAVVQ